MLTLLTPGGWAWPNEVARLKPLVRPVMILTITWFAMSVLT